MVSYEVDFTASHEQCDDFSHIVHLYNAKIEGACKMVQWINVHANKVYNINSISGTHMVLRDN